MDLLGAALPAPEVQQLADAVAGGPIDIDKPHAIGGLLDGGFLPIGQEGAQGRGDGIAIEGGLAIGQDGGQAELGPEAARGDGAIEAHGEAHDVGAGRETDGIEIERLDGRLFQPRQFIAAGLADRGQDFGRHPLAEPLGLRLSRTKDQRIHPALGYDLHLAALAAGVGNDDTSFVIIERGNRIPWVADIQHGAEVVCNEPRFTIDHRDADRFIVELVG